MTNYERIKLCIRSSAISPEDKSTMTDIFAEIADDNLADIANLFGKDKVWIERFNDNRKAKLKAAANPDPALFAEILEQEKKYLADLTYGLD